MCVYKKLIEDINNNHDRAIDVLTMHIQVTVVNPFCDKYRVQFWSGMGGYGFIDRRKRDLVDISQYRDHHYHKTRVIQELKEILKILELKGYPSDACSVGCNMADYPKK